MKGKLRTGAEMQQTRCVQRDQRVKNEETGLKRNKRLNVWGKSLYKCL